MWIYQVGYSRKPTVGELTRGILGRGGINADKIDEGEEGAWGPRQILLGFVCSVDSLTIFYQVRR